MANMLSQATPVAGPAQSNPLATNADVSPTQQQGQAGKPMPQFDTADIPDHIETGGYVMNVLAKLIANPKAKRKDVINAVGLAISDNKIKPSEAVKMLTDVPDAQEALRPWLKEKYGHLVKGMVHLHAMQHVINTKQAQQQQMQQQQLMAQQPPTQAVN